MIDNSLTKLFEIYSCSYSLEIISKTIFDFILAAINKEATVTFESPEDCDYNHNIYYIHWNNKILSLTIFVDGTIDNLDFDYIDSCILPDGVYFSYWDSPEILENKIDETNGNVLEWNTIQKFEPFGYIWPEPYNRIYDGDKLFMNILREAYYTKYPSK